MFGRTRYTRVGTAGFPREQAANSSIASAFACSFRHGTIVKGCEHRQYLFAKGRVIHVIICPFGGLPPFRKLAKLVLSSAAPPDGSCHSRRPRTNVPVCS